MLASLIAVLMLTCAGDPPAEPPAPEGGWLSIYSEQDQARITAASKHFVVDRDGVFWDLQVEHRRGELLSDGSKDQRILEAHGVGATRQWKTAPLWHAAAKDRTIYDPDVVAGLKAAEAPGYESSPDLFVCVTLMGPDRAVVERWEYSPGTDGKYPNFRRARNDMVLIGRVFESPGNKVWFPMLKELEPTKLGSSTLPTYEVAPDTAHVGTFAAVTAEQLAAAIQRGAARLTRWTWDKVTVPESERGPTHATPSAPPGGGPAGSFNPNDFKTRKLSESERLPAFKFVWRAKDVTPRPKSEVAANPST